ncbi:MAG: hypothetical protein WC380_08750 [Pedobacter sp.]|jgi:hypothetical protein
MNLRYKILFSIEIRHDYYTDSKSNDFEISPSPETVLVLKGQGMLFKVVENKLIVLIRVDENGKALIDFSKSGKLTFFMKLANPYFSNFTNLGHHPSDSKKYYFSNINQTKVGSDLYLSSKIPLYNNANDYPVGTLASNVSDTVFEAIKSSSSASKHALTNKDYWMNRGKIQYVNPNDLVEATPFIYLFKTTSDTDFIVNIYTLNHNTGAYDRQVTDTLNLSFSNPQTSIPVRLEKLPKGYYRIEVNGQSRYVYTDSNAVYNNIFGIIEIFNFLSASSSFALFDASGTANASLFTIRLPNRALIWKYVAKSNDVLSVKDSRPPPQKLSFIHLTGNEFISAKPVPVSQAPLKTLSLESAALGNISSIANPGTERLGTIEIDGDTYCSAEVYLNY